MKDIAVILVHYSDQVALHKALNSLKRMSARITSIMVYQDREIPTNIGRATNWGHQIEWISPAQTLNDTISPLAVPYVLFLQDTDYLSPTLHVDALQLSHPKKVLGTFYHNRNIVTRRPLLVSTSYLKMKPFFSTFQLPFKEALFPAWLSTVDDSLQVMEDGLVKQSKKNSSANSREKEAFNQKYQRKKNKTAHPTLSILISNYNMEKYIETSIVSCLLQNEPFEQLLMMDDGSTDHSYHHMKRWHDGNRVKVFHKKNKGKARALNQILPYVTSDFILELDADDWLDPDAISVIKKHLSGLSDDIAVLYGNFRRWKQLSDDVLLKEVSKGIQVNGIKDLLAYRFPLGPRIYRTSILKKEGGFPVTAFEDGRMYEDVSVLIQLIKKAPFRYHDFTVYNVREHEESITKVNDAKWDDFLKLLHLS